MARYPCERALSVTRSVSETTSALLSRPPALRKGLTRRVRFRVFSETNMLVRMLFVFIRLSYGPPSLNRYGAWVGFFPAAREVVGTPSFEGYDLCPKPGHDSRRFLFRSQVQRPLVMWYFCANSSSPENASSPW